MDYESVISSTGVWSYTAVLDLTVVLQGKLRDQ